jgi:hypothetical protein
VRNALEDATRQKNNVMEREEKLLILESNLREANSKVVTF